MPSGGTRIKKKQKQTNKMYNVREINKETTTHNHIVKIKGIWMKTTSQRKESERIPVTI